MVSMIWTILAFRVHLIYSRAHKCHVHIVKIQLHVYICTSSSKVRTPLNGAYKQIGKWHALPMLTSLRAWTQILR